MSHLVPPRDKGRRRRYYGLLGAAKRVPPHQRRKLLQLARSLMERADGEPLEPAAPRAPEASRW